MPGKQCLFAAERRLVGAELLDIVQERLAEIPLFVMEGVAPDLLVLESDLDRLDPAEGLDDESRSGTDDVIAAVSERAPFPDRTTSFPNGSVTSVSCVDSAAAGWGSCTSPSRHR